MVNANAGYWKVDIDERDRERTAFISRYGLCQVVCMSFGLKHEPATVQKVMDFILSSIEW